VLGGASLCWLRWIQTMGLRGFDVTTRLRTSSTLTARRRACAVPSSLTTTALWRNSKDFSRLNDVVAGASRMLSNLVSPLQTTGGRTTTAVRIEARPGGVPRAGIAEFDVSDTLSFLRKHGINPEGWGKSGAKSVGDLTREVNEGECVLRDGKRMIFVVKVIIRDGDHELVEARQVCMRNGSVKERQRCLSEKFNPADGSIKQAAYRGICEELGEIVGPSPKVRFVEASVCTAEERRLSKAFPGLMTSYTLYSVQAEIEGLTRGVTSDSFFTLEDGRVHHWEWRKKSPKFGMFMGDRAKSETGAYVK